MSKRTPNVNTIIIGGNIVRDPEIKEVGDKKIKVTTITIANNRPYLDKEGNWQEETTFVDVEAWGNQAKKIEDNAEKGSPILVEGNLKLNQWENNEGKTISKILIRADRIHVLEHEKK
ncbi:MAG: hypothetical protein B1H05_01610 [Candidatus Cloacimonas sp. 4484_140]|nr:MAG: hypothetical protein B1H05_01610 [Candidatus Cloacimonas sp. 4484_140]